MAAEQLLGGRYRLSRLLGTGGMASVYLAEDLRLGRRVAVKILHPQFAADPAFVARFDAEARTVAALAHPNIVQVYDVGRDGDRYYIVMEYVEGETLKDAIARAGALPVARALGIISGILAALEFAHAHGLVHRDIKAQNVLLTPRGDVKVADFGIARAIGGGGGPTLTATNMVIGTVQYFSPEQAQGRPATPQSDVYAAGVVLYEMLTGALPFEAENPLAVAMQQINQAPPLPTRLNRAIPAPVEAIVLKALAKNPAERYAGAAAMKAAVDAALAGAAEGTRVAPRVVAPPPTPTAIPTRATARTVPAVNVNAPARGGALPQAPPARPASRTPWIVAIALGLILLALVGALLHNGGFNGFGFGGAAATDTPTPATATVTPTVAPATTVPAVAPITTPTNTPATPTDTPAAATPTPQGATDTPTPATPTDTPATPTDTPAPATDTPAPATDTPAPSETPTDTPAPSETPTAQPSPTATTPPTATPAPTATTASGAATVTLTPKSVKPGDTFKVAGGGWPAGATLTIVGEFPDGTHQLGQTTVGGDGAFSAPLTLNSNTTAGSYRITVSDDQGDSTSSNLAVNSP